MAEWKFMPLSEIRTASDAQFNAMLVEALGCGIYTLLVCQTTWQLYCKGGKRLYSSALVVMWMATMVGFGVDFDGAREAFVSNNGSPLAIITSQTAPEPLFEYILGVIAAGISDAIIIWRCHVMWQKKPILSVLITLFCITNFLIFYGAFTPSVRRSQLMQALGVLCSFITTITATFLITLKIIRVTRQSHRTRHYAKIIEILVQSAAIVSIVSLVLVILFLIQYTHPFDLGTASGRFCYQLTKYLLFIQVPIAGIAPTLIAFRVAEEPSRPEVDSTIGTSPLSWLTFRRTTHDNSVKSNVTSNAIPVESA